VQVRDDALFFQFAGLIGPAAGDQGEWRGTGTNGFDLLLADF